MNPTTLTAFGELIARQGGWGLSILLMFVIAAQWLDNRRALNAAHDREVKALERVLPLAEKLSMGVLMVEKKQKRVLPPGPGPGP